MEDGYYLSQAKYAFDLFSCDSKIVSIHLPYNERLTPKEGKFLNDPTLYRSLVGELIYLNVTRLGITYDVHVGS